MNFQQLLEALLGLFVAASVLFDVFLTIVVPRRAPLTGRWLRLSFYVMRGLSGRWRWVGVRFEQDERREAFLGSFGALALMLLLSGWIAGLIVGYGLLLD